MCLMGLVIVQHQQGQINKYKWFTQKWKLLPTIATVTLYRELPFECLKTELPKHYVLKKMM